MRMPVTVIASIFTMSLALAGCGGEPQSTTTATPAITIPAASPSAVAAEDVCAVLTADEINQVLGTQFAEGEKETDDAREIVTCKYTMTDSSTGVELPVAIVNVGVSLIDGQESYDTNLDLALAYFGNEPETTEVPGTSQAYIVTNAETDSPVIGLLVGDRFVQIQIGVEGATNDEATQLAAMAAARSA